jgi:hypothetical protein
MKSSGVRFLSCSAFRGSDRFTVTVSIRQRQVIRRIADYRGDEKHPNYARHTVEKARQLQDGLALQYFSGNVLLWTKRTASSDQE